MPDPISLSRRAPAYVAIAVMVMASVFASTPVPRAETKSDGTGPALSPDPTPDADPRAVRQLERAAQASTTVPYAGEQFVSAWSADGSASTVVDVSNMPGTGAALSVRGSADGAPVAVFSAAPGSDLGVGLHSPTVHILMGNYSVRYGGMSTTAGRRAYVVRTYADRGVLAATFWIDKRSGILLRREVFDAAGRTVRASAFIDLNVGRQALPDHLPPMLTTSAAEPLDATQVAALRASGWYCPQQLDGGMSLYDVRSFDADGTPGVHLSYSDGLSSISVFQQRGTLDESGLTGYQTESLGGGVVHVRPSMPRQVVWSAGGIVYTVVADAPIATIDNVVAELPHDPTPGSDVGDRMFRGLSRVGSWINPFA